MDKRIIKPPPPDYVVENEYYAQPRSLDWTKIATYGITAVVGIAFWYWVFTSLTRWLTSL